MKVLITGVAGFIGFSVAKDLLKKKPRGNWIDNLNNYYSQNLKKERVKYLQKYKKIFIF